MHLSDDELVLHYYGEMREAAEARACAHLETCTDCRDNLARLQRVMTAIDLAPVPEPDAFFEQITWRRLQPALRRPSWWRRWLAALDVRHPSMGTLAWTGAAATLVLVAFLAGRLWETPQPGSPQIATDTSPVRERILLVDLGGHLDRTELALVEFVSGTNPSEIGGDRAADLIAANRLYRRTAIVSGDQGVADVLDELERVLIEIAGASPGATTADLDALRQRIDSRGLLFKVRVMRDRLQERAKDTDSNKGQGTTL
jgi:hypothetical protein